jgi:hypothetical protein
MESAYHTRKAVARKQKQKKPSPHIDVRYTPVGPSVPLLPGPIAVCGPNGRLTPFHPVVDANWCVGVDWRCIVSSRIVPHA